MVFADLFPAVAGRAQGAAQAWLGLLLVAALASSFTFACVTPFAAFAVLTVATLTLPRALAAMAVVWLINQALGYGVLGYPLDGLSLAWGGTIGVAALAGTLAAAGGIAAARAWPLWARLALGFVAAVAIYEAVLFLASLGLGGSENFSPAIVAQVALSDGCWLLGLAILRHFLLRAAAFRRDWRPAVTT